MGAPSTWVLSNHDVIRHGSRLALPADSSAHLDGLGPDSPVKPDPKLAARRGRAATALMLALPGSAYLYQGEELGLPEAIEIPADLRQDPTFHRTQGERYGRDGCRVPIPWEKKRSRVWFLHPRVRPGCPSRKYSVKLARDQQNGVEGSTLELYKTLLRLRRELGLGTGELTWLPSPSEHILMFFWSGM